MGYPKGTNGNTSPIVGCAVHHVDVMCMITDAKPVRINGVDLRISDDNCAVYVYPRPVAGDLCRWISRMVRGRMGPDDV